MIMRFLMIGTGGHVENGKLYNRGDVVESTRQLDVLFKDIFEALPAEPAPTGRAAVVEANLAPPGAVEAAVAAGAAGLGAPTTEAAERFRAAKRRKSTTRNVGSFRF